MKDLPIPAQILILAIAIFAVPALTGGILLTFRYRTRKSRMQSVGQELAFMWTGGQFILWAVFWVICVPCIVMERDFPYVVWIYGTIALLLAAVGGSLLWGQIAKSRQGLRVAQKDAAEKGSKVFWVLFALLLAFQLVQAVRMTYADGDDAYYVAVSSITANADTMYRKLPYTGGTTEVDIRHGLAPFPVWIAFLSRISGMRAVSVAHVVVPLALIPMTYVIFYLMGRQLFKGKERRIPLFLIFTELLVLFGDYSFYSVENFMIARSRQGKAALGSIVIPMLFVLLLRLMGRMQENKKCGIGYWLLLVCVMMTGCLCSTMGALLCCLLLAVTGMCAAVVCRRWRVLVPLALCCVPCVLCAVIYIMN